MLLQEIESKYSSAKIPCCNERCKIHPDTRKNHIILKGELLALNQSEKMCDCIIFQDDKTIAVIELKSKSLDARNITEKFCNSGKKSTSIAASVGRINDFKLYFILLAKNYPNPSAYDRIRRTPIKIDGKKVQAQVPFKLTSQL